MCGIISASSPDVIDFKRVKLGLLNADDRGGHSCGVALRGEDDNMIHQASNAKTFINDANTDVKFPRKNNSFIGHTRYATQGAKTIENAHPFRLGNIVGVHNGGLENFSNLKNKYINQYREDVEDWCGPNWKEVLGVEEKKDIDVQSDSKLLYYIVWKKGLRKALPEFKGTLALVFYMEEQGEEYMYLYRWDKPLCYGYKGDEMWIGSLKKYLRSLGCHNIKQVTEHALYKIKDGKIITSKQIRQDNTPKKKKVTIKDDYDPELEPNRTKTKTYYQYGGGSCGVTSKGSTSKNNNNARDRGFRFCAPKYARGSVNDDGKLVLYWFSGSDPDIVYIEVEEQTNVEKYDLLNGPDCEDLQENHSYISDFILEEYANISLMTEYREQQ